MEYYWSLNTLYVEQVFTFYPFLFFVKELRRTWTHEENFANR